jgi:multisubunit Na+/H+ antiporter MnhB subunit
LLFHLLIGLDFLIGLISVITFVLYVLARGKENEESEKRYQSIHFISLFIFVVLGVIILIMLSDMNL